MAGETGATGVDNTPDVIVVHNDAGNAGKVENASIDSFKEFEAKMAAEAEESTAGGTNTTGQTEEDQRRENAAESAADDRAPEEEGEEEKPAAQQVKAPNDPTKGKQPAEAKGEKTGRKSAKERIGELSRQKGDAERRAEAKDAENAELRERLARLERGEKPAPAREVDADGNLAEPDPAKFEYGELDPLYRKAVREYDKAELRREMQSTRDASEREREAREVEEAYDAQVEELDQEVGDFVEKVVKGAQEQAWACTPAMNSLIRASSVGAKVAYHLATNPAESFKVAGMTEMGQAAWFGRKEAELIAAPSPKGGKQGKPTAKISQADQPADLNRGQNGQFKKNAATDNFKDFEKNFAHLLAEDD